MALFMTAPEPMTPEFTAVISFAGKLDSGPNFFHVDAPPYPPLCTNMIVLVVSPRGIFGSMDVRLERNMAVSRGGRVRT